MTELLALPVHFFDNLFGSFHFLRPLWLFGLLLLPILYWLGKKSSANHSSWSQAINPQLLKYLLDDSQQAPKTWPLALFIGALALCFVALAGPVWNKIPQPVYQSEDALVIVLDQSLSLLATDVKPSRQVTVKHKLIDLLKARKEGQTALIVYAGDAHIVSPLTDDTRTIRSLVPALSPMIMPALGSRAERGIALANQALKEGGISQGRILLITDGIQQRDINSVSEQLKNSPHAFSMLVVGTENGGPIPIPEQGLLRDKGEIVIAKTDVARLQQLAQNTGALIATMSLNDSDLHKLLPDNNLALNKNTREVEREMDQWHEQGPWLLLLVLPFAALAFRRGWLLALFVVVLIPPAPAEAADFPGKQLIGQLASKQLWKNADQQAAEAFSNQDYPSAGKLFSDPQWQGSAAYRAGDYEAAAQQFAQSDSANAHYNRGNALAQLGQLEAAAQAYDEALKRDPELADAKANKQLIEQLAKQQQEQAQKQQQSDSQQSNNDQQQQSEQPDEQSSQQSSEQNADQNSEKSSEQSSEQASKQSSQNQAQSQQQPQNAHNKQQDAAPQSQESEQQKTQDSAPDADQDNAEQQEARQLDEKAAEQSAADSKEDQKAASKPDDEASEQSSSELAQVADLPELSDEQQQAMEQWLRRIPDDPSALLKNKFNYQYQQNRQNNEYLPQQEDEVIW